MQGKMPTNLVLYDLLLSPPARAVKMLATILNLELELKPMDLFNKEQYSEDFLKVNPTHSVPTLEDNGIIIWDSHAIMIYLVEKYGKDETLYPKGLLKRAEIHQLLFFEASIFAKLTGIARPIYFHGVRGITDIQIASLIDSYESVERILEGKKFIAGNEITIADLSFISTITSSNLFARIDPGKFPNITSWVGRLENQPFYHQNRVGLEAHEIVVKKMLSGEFTHSKK